MKHRRRIGVAAVVFACALLGACAPAGAGPEQGVFTFVTDSQPDCLDPQVSAFDATALVDRNIFDSLVSKAADGSFHPWLAQWWEISPDGLTYTFWLRPDVVFHDGTPLAAAAVKATLDHAVDPKTKSAYAASLLSGYTGATVLDRDTVRISLSRPQAPLLDSLSTAYLGIQSPKSLRDDAAELCRRPVGSGPFRFESWSRNQSISLSRNDSYGWGPDTAAHTGPAAIRGISIQFVAENSVRFGMLTSGQADAVGGLPAANVSTVEHSRDFRIFRQQAPGAVYTLYFNVGRAPLDDERVRLALLHAIRLDDLVKSVYFGQYERAWSPLSPATGRYYAADLAGSWRYDPALAGRLLDEAGWTGRDAGGYRTKDGRRLVLKWPYTGQLIRDSRDILGQGIQAEAKRAGIDIEYFAEDAGAYIADATTRNADLLASSFVRQDPDILRLLFASDQTFQRGGSNTFGVAVPQLDQWLEHGGSVVDPAARQADYVQAQRSIVEHALAMPVYVPVYLMGASSRVHGLDFDPQGYPRFYDISLEAS